MTHPQSETKLNRGGRARKHQTTKFSKISVQYGLDHIGWGPGLDSGCPDVTRSGRAGFGRITVAPVLPPPLPRQVQTLQRVLDRVSVAAEDGGPPPLVVFGLDGSIFDNRRRTLQVLLEYAEEVEVDEPDVSDALRTLTLDGVQYLLGETLRECGLHGAELTRDVTSFWRERFFTDDYAMLDEPQAGAVDYLRGLQEAGAGLIYLSGRDVPGMLLGTVASLREHGLPLAEPGVQLVLKPDATLGDESFKRTAFPRLAGYGEVVAVFDANPSMCDLARRIFPDADVAFVDLWELDPPPDESIELIRDLRLR